MDPREQRGLVIAAFCKLNKKEDHWLVPSQSGGERLYRVDPEQQTCTCPDHAEAGHKCKHLYAVEIVMKREVANDGTVTETKSITLTERKTYKQNWATYDEAQTTEKHRLQVLLGDLCKGLDEPKRQTGRKPLPLKDRIFACVMKVYSGLSHRRFICDMKDAHEKGHLSKTVHFSKVSFFLCEEEMTATLRQLVAQSALPLRAVETDFAVDSSGFSTNKFVRWYDHKYGVTRTGHDWVKVHVCTEVKTNVVTAIEIRDRDANDCPLLPDLVRNTAKNFTLRDVTADKGYLSAENVECITHFGGTPFIAPKCNTTGRMGGLFAKMVHYYNYRQEDFLSHYHKRSNVESTFSAIKRKFGDHVKSKTQTAMLNECLCKVLAHNLCCVIRSQIELGIEATFWDKPTGTVALSGGPLPA